MRPLARPLFAVLVAALLAFGAGCNIRATHYYGDVAYPVAGPERTDLAERLRNATVQVTIGDGHGSGFVIQAGDGSFWVWTAGHVAEYVRTVDECDGSVTYPGLKARKEILDHAGRWIGWDEWDVEVVRFSAWEEEDLCLLRLGKGTRPWHSGDTLRFSDRAEPLELDTLVYHAGAMYGHDGGISVTEGRVCYREFPVNGVSMFRTTFTALPGSSGGPAATIDGLVVGMLTQGRSDSQNACIPVYRLRAWALRVGIEFAVNPYAPVPEEFKKHEG